MKDAKNRKLTIVIVSLCKSERMMISCLDAIEKVPGDFEVILVLNNPAIEVRNSMQKLIEAQGYTKFICYINESEPGTFAMNSNNGAEEATGELLLFLNDDTIVKENFLDRPLEIFDRDPEVGIVGSKCIYPNGLVQHAGITLVARAGKQIAEHCFKGYEADHWLVNNERSLQAVTGACLFIRRADFEILEGFPENYKNGFEDLHLCFAVREDLHKKVVFTHLSEIIHLEDFSRSALDFRQEGNIEIFLQTWRDEIRIDFDIIHDLRYGSYELQ